MRVLLALTLKLPLQTAWRRAPLALSHPILALLAVVLCGSCSSLHTPVVFGWLFQTKRSPFQGCLSRLMKRWSCSIMLPRYLTCLNSICSGSIRAALRSAIARRHPGSELLHHSDRGTEFTSDRYQAAFLGSRPLRKTRVRTARQYLRVIVPSSFSSCSTSRSIGWIPRTCFFSSFLA